MEHQQIAKQLAELGHDTRLTVFRLLIKAGNSGMTVSEIQQALKVPGSTLSHHLHRLMKVDLVRQEREGRTLHCFARYQSIQGVVDYLLAECCVNESESCC